MLSIQFLGLLLLSVACSAYNVECDDDAPKRCVLPLISSLQDDKVDCDVVLETKECLVELAENCLEGEERVQVQSMLDELDAKISGVCGGEYGNYGDYGQQTEEEGGEEEEEEDEGEMLECVEEYMGFTMNKCGEEIVNAMDDAQSDEDDDDQACVAFLRLANCVSYKVAKVCGAEVEEPLHAGMIIGLKSTGLSELTDSPRCASAISDAEALVKERSKRGRR